MKLSTRILENFLELFLVFLGIILFAYVLNWKLGDTIMVNILIYILGNTIMAYTLGYIYGISFVVIFILQLLLLFVRWSKKERKEYIREKVILYAIISLITLVTILVLDFDSLLFLLCFAWIAVVIILYLGAISLLSYYKKIITSDIYTKWVKVFFILFGSVVFLTSLTFIVIADVKCRDESTWNNVEHYGSCEEYDIYLRKFPNGKYSEEALWRAAICLNWLDAYNKYLEKYPNGKYSQECLLKKNELNNDNLNYKKCTAPN